MKVTKSILRWGTPLFLIPIVFLSFCIYKWEYKEPFFEVYFFNLNRGRSIFIRTPENHTILIGGGQNSEVIREITKITPFYRRRIDRIITPSATPAQIGGLLEIIDRYDVGEIIMSKIMATSTVLTQLLKEVRKKKIHIEEVERGDKISIESSLDMDIFFPYKEFKFNKTSLPELGLSISYGSTTAYLLGNLSKTIQNDIANSIEIRKGNNVVEYYNSAIESKISNELMKKINPKFTFSTKEKTMHLVSNGSAWHKE